MSPTKARLTRLPVALFAIALLGLIISMAWFDLHDLQINHSNRYTNPVYDFDFPDPSVLLASDGWYYAYATQTVDLNGRSYNIQVARSKDLIAWEHLGDALPVKPDWASRTWNFWAPHVVFHDGTYYMYYSAEPDEGDDPCLAVASAQQPAGPFTDKGSPLKCGQNVWEIDPMAFDDPQTGKRLLYWGSAGVPIRVQELAPDRISFVPGTRPRYLLMADHFREYESVIEGSWVIFRNGFYYLFYSGDTCCGPQAHYAVMVARAKDAFGPFEKMGEASGIKSSVILKENARWKAPGHNSIITDASGQDWMIYHAINAPDPTHNDLDPNDDTYPRVLLMDPVSYVNGWPEVGNGTPSTSEMKGPVVR